MTEGGQRPNRFQPKVCARCGQAFRSPEPTKKYCTAVCRAKAKEARRPKRKHGGPSTVDNSPPEEEG